MSFSLYLGPFQPFLEEQLFQTFQAYREKNPFEKVTVLVPNFLLMGHLRKALIERGQNLFNLEIQTLWHHLETVTQEKRMIENLKYLPDVLVPLVLKEVSRPFWTENSVFNSVKDTPGFYHSLRSTLSELKEGLYTASSLKTHADNLIHAQEKRLGHKLREFSGILRAYENWKSKDHWLDREDIYLQALETPVASQGTVWIYGFYDASELQKKVLQYLTRLNESHWFIPYEVNHPAFEYADRFVRWVKNRGKVCAEESWKGEASSPLQRLQGQLFLYPKKETGDLKTRYEVSDCKIVLCPGEPREAKEIAWLILDEADRRNAFLSDCAVILRDVESYRKIMPSAFRIQGVPLSRSPSSPLLEMMESQVLLLLLDNFFQDFPRDGLMNLLSCSNLNPRGLGLAPEEWNPSYWDLISREAQIVEGEKEWISRLRLWRQNKEKRNAEEDEPPSVAEEIKAVQGFEKVLAGLFDARDRFNRHPHWAKKANVLKEILLKLIFPSEGLTEVLEVLEAFILLSEFFTLTLQPQDFYTLMAAMLKEKKTAIRQLETGGAQVVDLMQARGVSFDVILLPGLVEKSVPRLVRQDPLFLDEEREKLNGRAKEAWIDLKRSGALEERLLFTLAVRSARKAIILTAPILNPSSGSPRTPSIYLFETAEAVLGRRIRRLGEAAELVKVVRVNDWVKTDISQCRDPLERLLTAMAQARQGQGVNAQALVQEKPFYFEGCRLLKNRQALPVFTAYDGILSNPKALAALKKNYSLEGIPFSASRLETFAACPLRYFYRYILNLKAHPEPERVLQLQAMDRGNLMHDILEKTFKQGIQEGWVARKDIVEGLKALHQHSLDTFKRFERDGVPGAAGLWLWEKEQMNGDLERVIRQVLDESDWIPFGFEISFGDKDHPVGFTLTDGRKFQLQGRMDRVDVSIDQKKLRVIDYKTGSSTGSRKNSVKQGTKLQLPFYLWALQALYPDKHSSQARYDFITQRGDYQEVIFDLEQVGPLEPILGQILSTVVQGVEEGLFPAVGMACQQCDYQKLCGTGMENRGKKKKGDLQVRRYFQLEELP